MKSQFERMVSGELYLADDPELATKFKKCQTILYEYNQLRFDEEEKREKLLYQLLGACGENVHINTNFRCDYGINIYIGENFYANYDCIMLDVAPITIGNNVLLGPRVGIYTAGHPLCPKVRATGLEFGKKIKIGDNVWIGANCVIAPGVTVGNNVVIGAGSIVTKDVPDNVIAVGAPCKVLREISDNDTTFWQEQQHSYEEEYGIALS